MATVSDLTTTPLSGLNHIDALLDIGPDWNYMIGVKPNTIYYTFDISSGNEVDENGQVVTGQVVFNANQQAAARTAFSYLGAITGIEFRETQSGTEAQIHLANFDIEGHLTTGLCSWNGSYSHVGNNVVGYKPNAYVYLDHVEWGAQNYKLEKGTEGYQTLLHELGHALGLKHPFHASDEHEHIHLPTAQDNTGNTIMSYTEAGGPYSSFSPYDMAALNWLYGGDGLGGALGSNSTTGGRYITGTAAAEHITGTGGDDHIVGMGGNDIIDGGAGTDTIIFSSARGEYTFSESGGAVTVTHASLSAITLSNVELLAFTDGQYQRSQLTADTTPPAAPTLAVSKNAAGYTSGNKPLVTGSAEPNSIVRIYEGERQVAEFQVDANGLFSGATSGTFTDGLNHTVRATATDAAGNLSPLSAPVSFHVDATAPVVPTSSMTLTPGGNQPVFAGTAEANSTILLVRVSDASVIGSTKVQGDGNWRIDSAALPNGTYRVLASSEDIADNATSAGAYLDFIINSALNQTGDSQNNTFTLGAGNNAVNGGAGLDTVVYTGASDGFIVERGVYGVTVMDVSGALGTDNLVNVERIQFGDTMVALDIDGAAGDVYRLYRAAFDREPDKDGLAFWIKALDTGNYSLTEISQFFLADKEAQALYATDPSDAHFVTKLYAHVLHRPAEGAGFDYWVNGLKDVSRAEVLAFFSDSAENKVQVIGEINNGIEFPLA